MLTTIREKTQGIIASFILILLVIPFALWGINSYFETGTGVYVAKIDGQEVSQLDYRAAVDRFRGRLDPATMESPAFKQMVLSGLVEQTLLSRDAESAGYRISDMNLAQLIREVPLFQRDGQFDAAQYEAILRREGLTPRQFESRLRTEHLTRQVQVGLSDSAFVTDAEVAALARLLSQERVVTTVTVSPEPFLKSVTVEASDIEKYYETNADQFKTAEQVRVQFLELKAGAVDRNYRPDEAELKRIYDEEIARFVTPGKRRLSHILLTLPEGASDAEVRQTLGRIQEIEKKLRAGADFAQLAKQHSQDGDSARKGGDLGEWRPGLLPKTLEQPALSLKLRETSKPVRSEYGYHLLKLTAHTPEKRKTLAEVKAELTKQLQARRAEERFVDLAEKMRNLVYEQPDSLEAAANTLELEVQSSDWFTRSGGSGVARNLKVVEVAFHPEVISKSRNSDVVELDGQTMVALRVVDHRPSVRRPLAEVRIEIERTLRQRAAQEKTVALTQEWIKELRAGASLEKLAASRGLRTSGEKKITRERTTGLDRRIVESAFRAAPPPAGRQEYGVADLGSQGQAVFVLSRVIDTPPERLETAIRDKARRQLAERRGQGFYAAYRAGLRLNADVQILNDRL